MGIVDVTEETTGEIAGEASGLDGARCADALAASRVAIIDAELAQVRLVAQWCDLHSAPEAAGSTVPGAERIVALGGDGAPRVREFAAGELGVLLSLTTTAARALMRDVLDARHRHPRLWSLVLTGQLRWFQARHVVRAAHAAGLGLAQARQVDDRLAPYLVELPWGRMQCLVEAAVVEADPEGAEQRRVAAELARFVRTGRSTEHGTKTIYARARAGDAIFFFAMCDRIAQILALRGHPSLVDLQERTDLHPADARQAQMDVLRSEAIGILATPARALALLRWAESPENDPGVDPDDLAPPATLYVHVSHEAFAGSSGVARVEDVGPVTLEQAVDWLRHHRVVVRPVIDLNASPVADAYEVSPLVRETVELRHPVEVFPFGTLSSRRADKDHTRRYRPPRTGGPPGQTTPDNLGPLGRYHHRLKTHGGWTCLQPTPGTFYWRTPHGHWTRVDRNGTRHLAGPPSLMEDHLARLLAG